MEGVGSGRRVSGVECVTNFSTSLVRVSDGGDGCEVWMWGHGGASFSRAISTPLAPLPSHGPDVYYESAISTPFFFSLPRTFGEGNGYFIDFQGKEKRVQSGRKEPAIAHVRRWIVGCVQSAFEGHTPSFGCGRHPFFRPWHSCFSRYFHSLRLSRFDDAGLS